MPSQPQADSPFIESQAKRALGTGAPGGPSTAGKAGGVHPGRVSYPAPPGLQTGAAGRPSSSPGPAPGAGAPPPPQAPASSPAPTPGAGLSAQVAPQATTPKSDAQAAAVQSQQPSTDSGQSQDMGGAGQSMAGMVLDKMPKPGEVPPGMEVQTPYGTKREDPQTGADTMTLSPEGQQRYREAKAALRKKLGPMPDLLKAPGMPEFPIELGQYNYNPFTGRMERG